MTIKRLSVALCSCGLVIAFAGCAADEGTSLDAQSQSGQSSDVGETDAATTSQVGDVYRASEVDDGPACEPECQGKDCGDDGCGGLCGNCSGTFTCQDGVCGPCQPACQGKECGIDGCGDVCGTCTDGEICALGQCEPPPPPTCLEISACLIDACADAEDVSACVTDPPEDCGEPATESESAAAVTLLSCLEDKGCPLEDGAGLAGCQSIDCMEETIACSLPVAGETECHSILECIDADACPKNFATGEPTQACVASCLAQGNTEAVKKYWTLMFCVGAECIDNPDYSDPQLCFTDQTNNGGACGFPLRDCLASAVF